MKFHTVSDLNDLDRFDQSFGFGWTGGTVIAKNRPFSLTFCQIVVLIFPHHSVVAGRLPIFLPGL